VVPLICPDGGVNVLAWQHYEKGAVGNGQIDWSQTMSLGPAATESQVVQAMCTDYARIWGTAPLTESSEELAAAYNGWPFSNAATATFMRSSCHP
jgi:hypothetical protein